MTNPGLFSNEAIRTGLNNKAVDILGNDLAAEMVCAFDKHIIEWLSGALIMLFESMRYSKPGYSTADYRDPLPVLCPLFAITRSIRRLLCFDLKQLNGLTVSEHGGWRNSNVVANRRAKGGEAD